MNFLSRLFGCAAMTTAENVYYLSEKMVERNAAPILVEKLYAEQELWGGGWTLYSVTDRPSRPTMTFRGVTYDDRWGEPEVRGRHLSLSEVYNRLAAHEEHPAARRLVMGERQVIKGDDLGEEVFRDYLRYLGMREDGQTALRQDKPASDNPSYWRNWQDKLPAPAQP